MTLGLLIALASALATGEASTATRPIAESLQAEVARERKSLEDLTPSPFVDAERPRLRGLLDDAEALLKAGRVNVALETLASAGPGVAAISRASTGWDDSGKGSGKGIDALKKEWETVGAELKAGRAKFPSTSPGGQPLFIRALAEQSLGQIDEHHAVAVDYGRVSGVTSGAYYLGRAEGQLAFALFLSGLRAKEARTSIALPSFAEPIARIEDEIVSAYAKPGSTAQHTNFIIANSSLKLAKELNRHGLFAGALVTGLRSLFALGLATLSVPAADREAGLSAKLDEFAAAFKSAEEDRSIGLAFVEKAQVALEKSRAGGEAGDRERVRAAAIAELVLPRYLEITKGLGK